MPEGVDVHLGEDPRVVRAHGLDRVHQAAARGARRSRSSPGIGFGDYGDDHVRIALIENEHRLRQAVRGIKRDVQKGRAAPGRGVIAPRPATLEGHGVRLEPLSTEHENGLAEAANDGKLWELWFTSVPAPGKTAAYIDAALQGPDRTATCCPGWCAT